MNILNGLIPQQYTGLICSHNNNNNNKNTRKKNNQKEKKTLKDFAQTFKLYWYNKIYGIITNEILLLGKP